MVLFAVAAVMSMAGTAGAFSAIDEAGTVARPAERIITTGDGLLFPIEPFPRCIVGNNFGGDSKTYGSGGHQGVDIGADRGQAVYAVADGFLSDQYTSGNPGLGWTLWSVTDVKYRYFHLDAFAPGLEVGDEVVEGQVIGYVGDTGNAAPGGYHLHFEVRPGPHPQFGSVPAVDPVPLLDIPTVCTVYP
jgi:murein DD-endopeptidase MepM/ murein hydrolase activator NlpD